MTQMTLCNATLSLPDDKRHLFARNENGRLYRTPELAAGRAMMFVEMRNAGMSLLEIGEACGVCHTVVMYGLRHVNHLDAAFRNPKQPRPKPPPPPPPTHFKVREKHTKAACRDVHLSDDVSDRLRADQMARWRRIKIIEAVSRWPRSLQNEGSVQVSIQALRTKVLGPSSKRNDSVRRAGVRHEERDAIVQGV